MYGELYQGHWLFTKKKKKTTLPVSPFPSEGAKCLSGSIISKKKKKQQKKKTKKQKIVQNKIVI